MENQYKLKLDGRKYEALMELCYKHILDSQRGEFDAHEALLLQHLVSFHGMLIKHFQFGKAKYTIRLSQPEALAFLQYWNQADLTTRPYHNTIICNMVKDIDRTRHQMCLTAS